VLVVDDDERWTSSLSSYLRDAGFDVDSEHDGLVATERLRADPPDLLITDYFLRGLDGGKLCMVAKSVSPEMTTIILTAGADRVISSLRAPFADAVIAKNTPPVVQADLRAVLGDLGVSLPPPGEERVVVGHERLYPRSICRKLHAVKDYLDALHERMGDIVIGLDAQTRICFVNRMGCEFFGITEAEAIARPLQELLPVVDESRLMAQVDRTLAGDPSLKPFVLDLGGTILRISLSFIDDDDGHARALLVARDLTELRRAEQDRLEAERRLHHAEKLAAVGQMVAGVAHEINNPLGALLPNLDSLDTGLREVAELIEDPHGAGARSRRLALNELRGEITEILSDCVAASERIQGVVAQMRRFASRGNGGSSRRSVDEVVQSAISLVTPQIRTVGELRQSVGGTPPVLIDADALEGAIVNILLNAAQAIESTGEQGWIQVETGTHDRGVYVDITNSGPPIPPELHGRIFEPFFTTKAPGKGMGLGLSLCFDVVDAHDGHLEVHGEPDQPVGFRITLPTRDRGTDHPNARPTPSGPWPTETARILIVDDDRLVRQSYRRILATDHEVVAVAGGREALERIGAGELFDLVVCDLIMPQMTGMELYARVRKTDPSLAERFLFVTGGTNSDAAREFLSTSGRPWAYKPMTTRKLRAAVADCLAGIVDRPGRVSGLRALEGMVRGRSSVPPSRRD